MQSSSTSTGRPLAHRCLPRHPSGTGRPARAGKDRLRTPVPGHGHPGDDDQHPGSVGRCDRFWKKSCREGRRLLMMPDYFRLSLATARHINEVSIASTSQMPDAATGTWSTEVISKLGLPQRLFKPPGPPGINWALNADVYARRPDSPPTFARRASGLHDTASPSPPFPRRGTHGPTSPVEHEQLLGSSFLRLILTEAGSPRGLPRTSRAWATPSVSSRTSSASGYCRKSVATSNAAKAQSWTTPNSPTPRRRRAPSVQAGRMASILHPRPARYRKDQVAGQEHRRPRPRTHRRVLALLPRSPRHRL